MLLFGLWLFFFFFFNDTATTEIYTLSLHDALPICILGDGQRLRTRVFSELQSHYLFAEDRKSTRLNSSHQIISYAVFCLKKKKIVTSKIAVDYELIYAEVLYFRETSHLLLHIIMSL